MANYSIDLNMAFQALADPTRRRVIERLSKGPASVKELAEPFDMALPSFLQHLKVLESSKLVRSKKVGRIRTFQLQADQVKETNKWLDDQLKLWEQRLDQFDSYVLNLAKEEESNE